MCPKIITKKKWGGLGGKGIFYQIFPVESVVVHHTVTPRCDTKLECSNALLNMQYYHMNELGSDDIPFKYVYIWKSRLAGPKIGLQKIVVLENLISDLVFTAINEIFDLFFLDLAF